MMIAYFAWGASDRPRLGLVVSRKCGNAVVRNRWKRSLRAAFRLVQHELPRELEIVVMPQRKAVPDVARLQQSFQRLAARGAAKLATLPPQE
jgi:ribonuclease P protein component